MLVEKKSLGKRGREEKGKCFCNTLQIWRSRPGKRQTPSGVQGDSVAPREADRWRSVSAAQRFIGRVSKIARRRGRPNANGASDCVSGPGMATAGQWERAAFSSSDTWAGDRAKNRAGGGECILILCAVDRIHSFYNAGEKGVYLANSKCAMHGAGS
ncbi:hypothetical protein AAFF_G00413390 [Aldrovandia affinis]|uniref:Uncharacterized protein n=1 Tax=Aldrovandia affinis TaxID=143900 RepID=A0AAD7SB10_9TELE|nr:hypothetical protein AAFF_G00413390 [Aldrovandia affinis]